MRTNARRSLAFLAAVCCLVLGGAAHASLLFYGSTWTQNIQGVSIEITGTDTNADNTTDVGSGSCVDTVPAHVQTQIVCPTGLVGVSATSSVTSYSVSLTMPLFSLNTFTTGGAINLNTMATFMGSATIAGNLSMATANQGIPGMLTVRVAAHAAKGVNASMQVTGKTTLVKVPLSIGASGRETGYFTVLGNGHYITVDFYAWTPHTLTFTGLTSKFVALPTPTVVAMGSANIGGTVTLVSPSKISIDGPLAQRRTASFTALTLIFPEPSALWLLAAGGAGLALAHARSRESSR
jgi:hypothetical protein